MFRILCCITLVACGSAAHAGGRAADAVYQELAPCLTEGFLKATGPDATPASLSKMVREYFDLASVAAQKYGGRNFNRASNKAALMEHAAGVIERELGENLYYYAGSTQLNLDPGSIKEIRPRGRYQITGRVPGDEAFVVRVSQSGPHGCRIHAFFYGGLSITALMDDRLIRY